MTKYSTEATSTDDKTMKDLSTTNVSDAITIGPVKEEPLGAPPILTGPVKVGPVGLGVTPPRPTGHQW